MTVMARIYCLVNFPFEKENPCSVLFQRTWHFLSLGSCGSLVPQEALRVVKILQNLDPPFSIDGKMVAVNLATGKRRYGRGVGFACAASAQGSVRKLLFLAGKAEVVRQGAFPVRLLQICAVMFSFSETCRVPTLDFFPP